VSTGKQAPGKVFLHGGGGGKLTKHTPVKKTETQKLSASSSKAMLTGHQGRRAGKGMLGITGQFRLKKIARLNPATRERYVITFLQGKVLMLDFVTRLKEKAGDSGI